MNKEEFLKKAIDYFNETYNEKLHIDKERWLASPSIVYDVLAIRNRKGKRIGGVRADEIYDRFEQEVYDILNDYLDELI